MTTVLRVQHLQKRYGSYQALEDISFDVQKGEIFGIIGSNGAGKTSTMECIVGLREPSAGSIEVLGIDPNANGKQLRERIGVQLQEAALPDLLRVKEALQLFGSFYKKPIDADTLLKQWGLYEKRNTAFSSLSGGQKQRLFIALALINDPEIVFLDELTTGLDPQARRLTWELIENIRSQGKTVILVTHSMEEVEQLCDRIAVINHGRVVALDTPQALLGQLRQQLSTQPNPKRPIDRITFEDVFISLTSN